MGRQHRQLLAGLQALDVYHAATGQEDLLLFGQATAASSANDPGALGHLDPQEHRVFQVFRNQCMAPRVEVAYRFGKGAGHERLIPDVHL